MVFKRSKDQTSDERHLTRPLLLENGRPPHVLSATLYSLSGLVVAGAIWASVVNIRELTIAPGQIIPTGQVHMVQHFEGGIVSEILVREGDSVIAGQPLLRLDPGIAGNDSTQMNTRAASLNLQILRLDAQSKGETPDFSSIADADPRLVREQMALYDSEMSQFRREQEALTARMRQRQSEIKQLTEESIVIQKQLKVQAELVTIQENLLKQGYAAKRTYLDAKSALQRAENDVVTNGGRLTTAKEAEGEARAQLQAAEAAFKRKISDDRAKASGELAEVESTQAKAKDRYDRLIVRATDSGIIQEVVPRTVGEVVRPGDTVARIVPEDRKLVAEVRIDPKDIGHIQQGARADVKLNTFDPAMYGSVEGVVERISASTFIPQAGQQLPGLAAGAQNEPYYRATISLKENTIGEGKLKRPLMPGMVVSAEILTGNKSIVRYMLKPVFRAVDRAFSER